MFAVSLTHIFIISFIANYFPLGWKQSKVVPVNKKRDKTDILNYRPVSITSNFSTVIEMVFYSRLYEPSFMNITIALWVEGGLQLSLYAWLIRSFLELLFNTGQKLPVKRKPKFDIAWTPFWANIFLGSDGYKHNCNRLWHDAVNQAQSTKIHEYL